MKYGKIAAIGSGLVGAGVVGTNLVQSKKFSKVNRELRNINNKILRMCNPYSKINKFKTDDDIDKKLKIIKSNLNCLNWQNKSNNCY